MAAFGEEAHVSGSEHEQRFATSFTMGMIPALLIPAVVLMTIAWRAHDRGIVAAVAGAALAPAGLLAAVIAARQRPAPALAASLLAALAPPLVGLALGAWAGSPLAGVAQGALLGLSGFMISRPVTGTRARVRAALASALVLAGVVLFTWGVFEALVPAAPSTNGLAIVVWGALCVLTAVLGLADAASEREGRLAPLHTSGTGMLSVGLVVLLVALVTLILGALAPGGSAPAPVTLAAGLLAPSVSVSWLGLSARAWAQERALEA